uniref:GM08530p n=1 Tax=Drosophila melanogaster TaxID=7227 RepID=Q8T947_DROME|nr:GM08530p [Drosophila melanogaster]
MCCFHAERYAYMYEPYLSVTRGSYSIGSKNLIKTKKKDTNK